MLVQRMKNVKYRITCSKKKIVPKLWEILHNYFHTHSQDASIILISVFIATLHWRKYFLITSEYRHKNMLTMSSHWAMLNVVIFAFLFFFCFFCFVDSLWAAQTGEQWASKENGRRSSSQESRLGTAEVMSLLLF